MSHPSIEIVKKFQAALDTGDYEAASKCLASDVSFVSPKFDFQSREEWLKGFPKFHKKGPTFDEPNIGENDKQVVRTGYKKVMGISISMIEILEINDDGLIQSSLGKKA